MPNFLRAVCALLAIVAMGGCAADRMWEGRYYKLVALDKQGNLIASYVAKGRVKRNEDNYEFEAVERLLGTPRRLYRFPLGWKTSLAAPRIVMHEVGKPVWLVEETRFTTSDRAEETITVGDK